MPTLPHSPRPAQPPAPQQPAISRAVPLLRKRRTAILTGVVAITTVAGTLVGAVLKSRQQVEEKQTLKKTAETDTKEQIASLESARGQLVTQKVHLEMKIKELQGRQEKKGEAEVERSGGV